jgi:hypothetical protein
VPISQVDVAGTGTIGYTVVVPYTTSEETTVIVWTFEVDCVTVTQAGVDVCVRVLVTVGIERKELQNGVATCYCFMMMALMALQLKPRSSAGDAKVAEASEAISERYLYAMTEVGVPIGRCLFRDEGPQYIYINKYRKDDLVT